MVPEDPRSEKIPGIPGDHTSEWAVIEIRILSDGLVEPDFSELCDCLEIDYSSRGISPSVKVLKVGHVHGPRVSSRVQVISRWRRVRLNEIVGILDALWCS